MSPLANPNRYILPPGADTLFNPCQSFHRATAEPSPAQPSPGPGQLSQGSQGQGKVNIKSGCWQHHQHQQHQQWPAPWIISILISGQSHHTSI